MKYTLLANGFICGFTAVFGFSISYVIPLQKQHNFYKNEYIQNACSSDMFVERLADTEDEHWVLCRKSSNENDLYKSHVKKYK